MVHRPKHETVNLGEQEVKLKSHEAKIRCGSLAEEAVLTAAFLICTFRCQAEISRGRAFCNNRLSNS